MCALHVYMFIYYKRWVEGRRGPWELRFLFSNAIYRTWTKPLISPTRSEVRTFIKYCLDVSFWFPIPSRPPHVIFYVDTSFFLISQWEAIKLPKSLCIPCAHWLDYLEKYFELDIRNLDQWPGTRCPETFGTALDENLRAKRPVIHQRCAFPTYMPPFLAARSGTI
jgi:hypothetical protein